VVTVGVVYEPGNSASEAEAAEIEQRVGGGLATGSTVIRVRKISTAALGELANLRVAFVTAGIREQQAIADVAAHNSILTITSDLACVRASRCVLGVSGSAQPQIIVSRAAARANAVRFGSAFLMLVREI
jgi:hypothetical protein